MIFNNYLQRTFITHSVVTSLGTPEQSIAVQNNKLKLWGMCRLNDCDGGVVL